MIDLSPIGALLRFLTVACFSGIGAGVSLVLVLLGGIEGPVLLVPPVVSTILGTIVSRYLWSD